MGCCNSREAASDGATTHPYAPHATATHESSRHITAHSPHRPGSTSSARGSHASQSRAHGKHETLPNRPLLPINPHRRSKLPDPYTIPTSTSSRNPGSTPWTLGKLVRERNDWWESRPTGRQDIWAAYREMVLCAQKGDVEEAQALLDACGCTCPSGKLWRGIYDESGEGYMVVDGSGKRDYEWVVFEPEGLAREGEGEDSGKEGGIEGWEWGEKEGKGKERAEDVGVVEGEGRGGGEKVVYRCRLSTTGKDHEIKMRKGEPIGVLMAYLSRITGLPDTRHRVSYLGRIYAPSEHLPTTGNCKWQPGYILNILVLNDPPLPPPDS